MKPKALVLTVALVNLAAGITLGIGIDQVALSPEPGAAAAPSLQLESTPSETSGPIGDAKPDARRGRRGEGHQQDHFTRLTQELDLTEEQKTAMMEVFQSQRSRFHEVMEQVRPEFDRLKQETHAELAKVLSPEQMTKLEAMDKARSERRRGRGRGGWGRRGDGKRPWGRDGRRGPGGAPGGELTTPETPSATPSETQSDGGGR